MNIVVPRMSNTAEILTKQFRETIRRSSEITNDIGDNQANDHWSWRRFKEEFLNMNQHKKEKSENEVNELFPKYLTRLQHNFFVLLLFLNTFFNIITIVLALVNKSDSKYPGILFLYFTSLIVFFMFLIITFTDEYLLRPKFSRNLASITVLITMIFSEYGNELLQLNRFSNYSLQRIRPILYIIIADHLLLPFSRISAIISSIMIICIEVMISLHQRLNLCQNREIIIRLTISEVISYLYGAFFGLYMSRLLEIIIRRAFRNHRNYIESKFNIYQEHEHQEQLLHSCFPKHLIDDVRKDLKEMIKVLDRQGTVSQRPFKKLYVNKYDNVSILYADIVNSMLLTTNLNPNELVETLNDMFGRFDECADKNKCLRIKLLGDCYYCVSGLPNYDPNHAWNCLKMGLDMIKIINSIRKSKNININMRIGIHSGMVLSGIIGVHKWQFDIWSEDSILASQMEHDGVPGCVHITKETLDLLPKEKIENFNIEEKTKNDRVGFLITKKSKKKEKHQKVSLDVDIDCSMQELSSIEDQDDSTNQEQDQSERFKEKVCKIRRRTSFSTIRSRKTTNSFNESNMLQKYLNMKRKVNMFIDQEIEQMPLSFKKNFKNFHEINPITLTFEKLKQKASSSSPSSSSPNSNEFQETQESDGPDNNWQLEKEFLNLPDNFFLFYLFFALLLCMVIGLNKNFIIPKSHINQIVGLVLQSFTIIIILVCCFYSCRNLIKFDCKIGKELVIQQALNQYDSANCPYIWSFTLCIILSMTGISVFITVNLWFKFLLRIIGLICFIVILLNDCSLYQLIISRIKTEKQWISNVGFDPIFSHFYYMFMAVIILTIIDRQIEYVFRLDFKLLKRLQKEKQDAKIMGEINEILLKNILPSYVVRKYLNNSSAFTNQLYSESYHFCVVMFASIPNYSEFYSENKLNDNGRKCLQLLNEIICDFDQLLSYARFQKIEKIKTIGSTYMAAAGLQPGRGSNDNESNSTVDERKHVMNLIHFVMALMETLKKINQDALQDFKLRVGIAVGPVIAGIVGASKPQYDIWGDTVNVASRMESTGVIGRIQITKETAKIIFETQGYTEHFTLEGRGPIQVKGKGSLITYLVKTKFDFEETEITYV